MSELRILAGQIDVPATRSGKQRDIHIQRCAGALAGRLKSAPVDLVVLPELSAIEYSREAFQRLERLAEPLDGPSFRIYRELAVRFGTTVIYGIARAVDGGYTITQAAVGPDGLLLGHYDKLHLAHFGASMEKDYFVPGDHLLVLDVKGFRVAPIICYDIRVPELSRTLSLHHHVDLILHCGAYCRDESFDSWHAFVTTRAMENQCFMLSLNRAGGRFGHSIFCPPWASDTQPAQIFDSTEEDLQVLCVDKSELLRARQRYPFLQDKLDDYRDLDCRVVGTSVNTADASPEE